MDSKITLGLGGIVIVLASVASSIGFFGFVGVSATLIIMEVFLFNFIIFDDLPTTDYNLILC